MMATTTSATNGSTKQHEQHHTQTTGLNEEEEFNLAIQRSLVAEPDAHTHQPPSSSLPRSSSTHAATSASASLSRRSPTELQQLQRLQEAGQSPLSESQEFELAVQLSLADAEAANGTA